jgi:hypothetical protein
VLKISNKAYLLILAIDLHYDPTRSILLFHIRQTCLINLQITRELDVPLEHPLIHHPCRLEGPCDEEISAAGVGPQHKRPLCLVCLHQFTDSAHAISHLVPGLLSLSESSRSSSRCPSEASRVRRKYSCARGDKMPISRGITDVRKAAAPTARALASISRPSSDVSGTGGSG